MNYTKKYTALLLLIALLFCLCACGGEAPTQETTDNRPTVMITETTAVLNSESTDSISSVITTRETEYDEWEPPRAPIVSIEPVSKNEVARFLFSCSLDSYYFDYVEDAEALDVFRNKMTGGTVFTITSAYELEFFHRFLETASDAGGGADSYGAFTKEQLYGGLAPDFFETSILVYYMENAFCPSKENSYVADYGDYCVIVSRDAGWVQIPEGVGYRVGFSCWAVSREALQEKEVWVRSSTLRYVLDSLETPYSVENYAPGELTEKQLILAQKCFTRVDDPTILPLPEGYKSYISFEGNITHKFEFEKDETIEPFIGFIKTESDFENILATFESVLDLPSVEYELEDGFFDEYDILYVVGQGGEIENYYYTMSDNIIDLHILPKEGDELYITFFRVSKDLGDYYNIDLRFLR